jgi:hypothetical protein
MVAELAAALEDEATSRDNHSFPGAKYRNSRSPSATGARVFVCCHQEDFADMIPPHVGKVMR